MRGGNESADPSSTAPSAVYRAPPPPASTLGEEEPRSRGRGGGGYVTGGPPCRKGAEFPEGVPAGGGDRAPPGEAGARAARGRETSFRRPSRARGRGPWTPGTDHLSGRRIRAGRGGSRASPPGTVPPPPQGTLSHLRAENGAPVRTRPGRASGHGHPHPPNPAEKVVVRTATASWRRSEPESHLDYARSRALGAVRAKAGKARAICRGGMKAVNGARNGPGTLSWLGVTAIRRNSDFHLPLFDPL